MMGSKSARNLTSWRMACQSDPAERSSATLPTALNSEACRLLIRLVIGNSLMRVSLGQSSENATHSNFLF